MTTPAFSVRPSGSRFYPWEWKCLLRVADNHGSTKPCRARRLTRTRADAEFMAKAHHNNLHRAPEEPAR